MDLRKIKDLREDHDLTQQQIAKILGISQRYYSNLENGSRTMSADILIMLADYYGVSLDYLANRTVNKDYKKK